MTSALGTTTGRGLTVVDQDGTPVPLVPVAIAGGGVESVTAAPSEDPGVFVDNTDPANPTIQNTGVLDVVVDAPLLLISGPPHVELAIDTSGLTGGTEARANKDMVASVTVADGDQACATAVAFAPSSSSAQGGYFGADVNGVLVSVGDGTKVGVACYFSGDAGVTPRAMRNIVAGDKAFWNGTVAGYQLAASDRISFHYPVTT